MTGDAHRDGRVAVTGIGLMTPLGCDCDAVWNAWCGGESGIRADPDATGLPTLSAAMGEIDAKRWIRSAHRRRMDRLSRWVVAAGRAAVENADVDVAEIDPARVGVVVGTAFGDLVETKSQYERLFSKGAAALSPLAFPNLVLNAPASYLSMELGITGPNLAVSELEASGELAIASAVGMLRSGSADLVLAGGGDEIGDLRREALRSARALSGQRGGPEACRPYDVDRNGLVLGEGAAVLALEPYDRAAARGAPIVAVIEEAGSLALPATPGLWPADVDEAARRVRGSRPAIVDDAGIDLIVGSGSSSRRLDAFELELFTALLGDRAPACWIASPRAVLGDFGGAGAVSVAAAAMALHTGVVPPFPALGEIEGGAPFRAARGTAESVKLERALVSGLARGGAGVFLRLARARSS